MKKLLLNNLKYFIVVTILSTLFWGFIFDNITSLKPYEKVEIFITAEGVNKEKLLNKISNEKIKGINITNCGEDDEYYTTSLETLGIVSSDILIVKKDLILRDGATTSFVELDSNYLKEFNINLNDFTAVYVDNKAYAIVVYDKSNNINLLGDYISYVNEDEVYCLTLNNISYHVGKYSIEQETTTVVFEILYSLLYK